MGIQLQNVQIGHPRDRAPITWQIGVRRTNHDREFRYRYDQLINVILINLIRSRCLEIVRYHLECMCLFSAKKN